MFSEKPNKKNRNRGYNRFQRERSIQNKSYILKHIMNYDNRFWTDRRVGMLNKGKVHCSCKMCRYAQHYGIDKFKYQNKEKWLKDQIKEFENYGE